MKKHKKSLIIILTLITILSSVVYAETANKKELKDETVFDEELDEEFEELKGELVFEEDEIVITPRSDGMEFEKYVSEQSGGYSYLLDSSARNLNVYFYNQSDSDVKITVRNLDRPKIRDSYTVEAGTNPTKKYRNIKPGEEYSISIRTIDGSYLLGRFRIRTFN